MPFSPWAGTNASDSSLFAVFFVDENNNLVFFNRDSSANTDRVDVIVPGMPPKVAPIKTNAFMLPVSMRRPDGVDESASCEVRVRSARVPGTTMAMIRLSLDRGQMRAFCDAFWENIPTLQEKTLRDKMAARAPPPPPSAEDEDEDDIMIVECVEWKPLRDPFMFCHLSDVGESIVGETIDEKMARPILFTCCNSLHNPYAFFRSVVPSRIQSGSMPFTCPNCKAFEAFPERIIKRLAQSHTDRLRGHESYRIEDKRIVVK